MAVKNPRKSSKLDEIPTQKQIRNQGSKFKLKATDKAFKKDLEEPVGPEGPEEPVEQREKENSDILIDIKPLQEAVIKEVETPQPEQVVIAPPPEPLQEAVSKILECHWFPLEKVILAINY
jgi:hypothetical protein